MERSDVMATDRPTGLPRPFYDQWPRRLRSAAHALWHWHSGLTAPRVEGAQELKSADEDYFDEEHRRAEEGEPLRLLPDDVWAEAYAACDEHALDRRLLAAQVDASRVFRRSRIRFETSEGLKRFVGRWAVPHGRLLARLAGVDLGVHFRYVDELARGFFHLGRLVSLPRDVQQDRLFIPQGALDQKSVSLSDLQEGRVNENVRGLLWKESVRIRDALAQGRPLIGTLSLRHRFALKRFWMGALELLQELERREYDLWSEPLGLSLFRRVQVYLQTLLGRSVSR